MKKYSISYSKTNEDNILEDNHPIYGTVPWNTLDTKKHIVAMLNEKEEKIEELSKENEFLKWYYETLRVNVPKETLKVIDEFYETKVKK